MTQEIKLTIDEVAEKLCKQLIDEGFAMSSVEVKWDMDVNVDLGKVTATLQGATVIIKE